MMIVQILEGEKEVVRSNYTTYIWRLIPKGFSDDNRVRRKERA